MRRRRGIKIDFDNCMKRKCEQCKFYDLCFGYRGTKNERVNTIKQHKQISRKNKL